MLENAFFQLQVCHPVESLQRARGNFVYLLRDVDLWYVRRQKVADMTPFRLITQHSPPSYPRDRVLADVGVLRVLFGCAESCINK